MFEIAVNFNDFKRFATDHFQQSSTNICRFILLFRTGNPEFISEEELAPIVMQAMTTMKDRNTRILVCTVDKSSMDNSAI